MSQSQPSVIWIPKQAIATVVLVILIACIALVAFLPRQNTDAAIFDPARRVAHGLATQSIYLQPENYKNDLTWTAYQQLLAVSPQHRDQNAKEPSSVTFVRYGATLLLDQGLFGDNTITALVQTLVKKGSTTLLIEYQLQMVRDNQSWKVNNVIALNKGKVEGE